MMSSIFYGEIKENRLNPEKIYGIVFIEEY